MIEVTSGGQTGVDQAALRVAYELGIKYGGWCPAGRLAEQGQRIPSEFKLQETPSPEFSQRTAWNMRDSDGTLIIIPSKRSLEKITDGTHLTIREAQRQAKPFMYLDLSKPVNSDEIIQWMRANNIRNLNIAGPRESQAEGIYQQCYTVFNTLFPAIINALTPRAKL